MIYDDFKKMENASVKAYAHVRINVSGSPLECRGLSLASYYLHVHLFWAATFFSLLSYS